ncbi:MAG: V4R domain-containing protein [Candidatus Bathyarchaeia archaeon]
MCTYQLIWKGVQQTTQQYYEPLNMGRIILFDKNQKIYGIIIQSKIEQGVLRKIAELAEKLGVIVRYIQISMPKAHEPTITAIAFIDFSNSKTTPEKALELVKKQKFIKTAHIIKPKREGIIFDSYFFPLIAEDERAVIFRRSVYEALFNGVRRKFGSAGEAMLYYEGFAVGFEIYDRYMKAANSENLEDIVEVAKAVNMTLGWGIIDKIRIDVEKRAARVRIHQNFECELSENNGKPYSQFYRGAIAGLFTRFFKKDVKVQETKCIAKGDPYCEFTIKSL